MKVETNYGRTLALVNVLLPRVTTQRRSLTGHRRIDTPPRALARSLTGGTEPQHYKGTGSPRTRSQSPSLCTRDWKHCNAVTRSAVCYSKSCAQQACCPSTARRSPSVSNHFQRLPSASQASPTHPSPWSDHRATGINLAARCRALTKDVPHNIIPARRACAAWSARHAQVQCGECSVAHAAAHTAPGASGHRQHCRRPASAGMRLNRRLHCRGELPDVASTAAPRWQSVGMSRLAPRSEACEQPPSTAE
jgi:hypothetical protein